MKFLLLLLASALVHSSDAHVQSAIRQGTVPARAVNLGGWLVAESWMTYDSGIWTNVSQDICDQGEYVTMKHLGHDEGDARFETHRSTWITESDIKDISDAGLNTVRVPVGYWIVGQDSTDTANLGQWKVYAPGALKYLDRLVNEWSLTYDVAVILSLHAHKGSQNGRDHSAPMAVGNHDWYQNPENVENSVQWATFLASRYQQSPGFLGLNLMNEPEYPTDPEVVHSYYKRAYKLIRDTGNNCVIGVSPMLTEQNAGNMQDFMRAPEYANVWHEFHPYFKWGYEGLNEEQLIQAVANYANNTIDAWHGNWLFMGEWSMGSPDSAPFVNTTTFQRFGQAQLDGLRRARAGWSFWSWHQSDDNYGKRTGWSLRGLLRDGDLTLTQD